jgi:hypothetical protein
MPSLVDVEVLICRGKLGERKVKLVIGLVETALRLITGPGEVFIDVLPVRADKRPIARHRSHRGLRREARDPEC